MTVFSWTHLSSQSTQAQDCGRRFGYDPCPSENVTFSDVSDSQFKEAIEYVQDEGIVNGYDDGTFRPDAYLNRAELTKILIESTQGSSIPSSSSCFSDVETGQWFSSYVCFAVQQGYVNGYSDGTFRPGNQVNVAETVKVLAEFYGLSVGQVQRGQLWFDPYVQALAVESALPGTLSEPTDLIKRGELAEMIYRLREEDTSKPSLTACELSDSLCDDYTIFSDVQGHPYQESIEFLAKRGILSGYDDGTFHPWDPINRAELLRILLPAYLGSAQSVGREQNCFSDVQREWFAPYVCYAKSQNVIGGFPDGTFRPSDSVSMIQALKMALETYGASVRDAGSSEQWFLPYVEFAHNNNLFSRFSYVPTRLMNRGEVAWMIHQLLLNREQLQLLAGKRLSGSAGCGLTPPGVAPTASTINGVRQTYITDVPSGYDQNMPISLTFAWHGRTNSNSRVRSYYKVYEAAGGDTIMVYPAGTGPWNLNRDVAIFDQLLQEFSQQYCIDTDRIYVVGHSLGAWFTNSLACVRGDVIRASGSLGGGTTRTGCSGPVAAITMHNPADRLSPFSAGTSARDLHLEQNACGQATTNYSSPDKAHCVEYTECAPDQPVVWCPHTEDYSWGDYYPHGWPRWTGELIWEFFESLE